MKNILIPTDSIDNAKEAINFGVFLFKKDPVTFHVLGVYEKQSDSGGRLRDKSPFADHMLFNLDRWTKGLAKLNNNPEHGFHTLAKEAPFVKAISDTALSIASDIIITKSKLAQGNSEIFIGPYVVKVLGSIKKIPIFVVPEQYVPSPPKHIVFCTNFKRAFDKKELEVLVSMTKKWKSKVTVAQLQSENAFDEFQKVNKTYLKDIFYGTDLHFINVANKGSDGEPYSEFAREVEADLVAIVNHRYNFLQNLIHENVIRKVTFNSHVPLLVLPELTKGI